MSLAPKGQLVGRKACYLTVRSGRAGSTWRRKWRRRWRQIRSIKIFCRRRGHRRRLGRAACGPRRQWLLRKMQRLSPVAGVVVAGAAGTVAADVADVADVQTGVAAADVGVARADARATAATHRRRGKRRLQRGRKPRERLRRPRQRRSSGFERRGRGQIWLWLGLWQRHPVRRRRRGCGRWSWQGEERPQSECRRRCGVQPCSGSGGMCLW